MEKEKRKEIEARLFKLIAETNRREEIEPATQKISSGVKVIRRRKGIPDRHIV